jgi:hypothetical protein
VPPAPTTDVFRGFSTEAAETEARHLANRLNMARPKISRRE